MAVKQQNQSFSSNESSFELGPEGTYSPDREQKFAELFLKFTGLFFV
jgi:hypothetical protein